jgi:hypothetical protein
MSGRFKVEQDQIVIIQLPEIEALLAEVGGVDAEALAFQHQLDAAGHNRVVLDHQDAHGLDHSSG